MSGINEFNNIQPEQLNHQPDAKTGRRFLLSAVLTALIITGIAAAGFTMNLISKIKDDPYGMLVDQVASEISLNEQQKTEVKKIKDEMNEKIGGKKIKGIKKAAEIEMLFRSDSFDREKAVSIAQSQNAENRELALYAVDKLEELHSLLTNKQRNDAVDKVKELYSKFKNMKNRK